MTRLSFVGDISLGEHYFSFGHGPRSLIEKDIDIFENVRENFIDSDFLIGNLEGPISDFEYDKKNPHSRVFRGSPKSGKILKSAGFNLINIANNHSVQHGVEAIKQSISLLEEEGITVIGLRERPITFLDFEGITIAIIGCSLIHDNTDINQKIYYAPTPTELINTVVEAKIKSNHIVVYIHWGTEGTLIQSPAQETLANQLKNVGANIIVGHHTHSLQPIHITENSFVAYSLGNFVFDLPWSGTNRESGILKIDIDPKCIKSIIFENVAISDSGKPQPTGDATHLKNGKHNISKLASQRRENEATSKLLFFIRNLLRGDTLVKVRFLVWKILKRLK